MTILQGVDTNTVHLIRRRQRKRIVRRHFRRIRGRGLMNGVGGTPERIPEKYLRVLPSMPSGQLPHVSGKTADHLHAQVVALVLPIPVGRRDIEMLEGRDLGANLPERSAWSRALRASDISFSREQIFVPA